MTLLSSFVQCELGSLSRLEAMGTDDKILSSIRPVHRLTRGKLYGTTLYSQVLSTKQVLGYHT